MIKKLVKKEDPVGVVKRKLWMFAYSVKDYTGIQVQDIAFDLLVDGKIKVKVGTQRPKELPNDVDVFALVERGKVKYFTKANGLVENTSPSRVFGKTK